MPAGAAKAGLTYQEAVASVVLGDPVLVGSSTGTNTTSVVTATLARVDEAAIDDGILICVGRARSDADGEVNLGTPTDSISNLGAWTSIEVADQDRDDGSGVRYNQLRLHWAPVNDALGTGGVTQPTGGTAFNLGTHVYHISGADRTQPFAQMGDPAANAIEKVQQLAQAVSVTFDATPDEDHLVFSSYFEAALTNASVSPSSGFTELLDAQIGSSACFGQDQFRRDGAAGATVAITGSTASDRARMMIAAVIKPEGA